jgi:hypothetical protein
MDSTDDFKLCSVPVSILLNSESRTWELAKFTLANGRDCIFCNFCAGALNSTKATARKLPLEGKFEVTVNVKRHWGY